MKDRFGIPLEVGDAVFYIADPRDWGGVTRVTKITAQRIFIYDPYMNKEANMNPDESTRAPILVKPKHVIRIQGQLDANKQTHPELFI